MLLSSQGSKSSNDDEEVGDQAKFLPSIGKGLIAITAVSEINLKIVDRKLALMA